MSLAMPKSMIGTVVLSGLCLALGWFVYGEATQPPPAVNSRGLNVPASPADASAVGAARNMTNTLPPIEVFGEITSRPLFNVSRRPIAVQKEKPTLLNVMLSGTVIDHTQQIAHLRSLSDKRVRALRVGDHIGGWRIEAIEPDRVLLRAGDRVETIYMQKSGPGDAPAARADRQPRGRISPRTNRNPARPVRRPPRKVVRP